MSQYLQFPRETVRQKCGVEHLLRAPLSIQTQDMHHLILKSVAYWFSYRNWLYQTYLWFSVWFPCSFHYLLNTLTKSQTRNIYNLFTLQTHYITREFESIYVFITMFDSDYKQTDRKKYTFFLCSLSCSSWTFSISLSCLLRSASLWTLCTASSLCQTQWHITFLFIHTQQYTQLQKNKFVLNALNAFWWVLCRIVLFVFI